VSYHVLIYFLFFYQIRYGNLLRIKRGYPSKILPSVYFLLLIIVNFLYLYLFTVVICFFNHLIRLNKLIKLSQVNDQVLDFFYFYKILVSPNHLLFMGTINLVFFKREIEVIVVPQLYKRICRMSYDLLSCLTYNKFSCKKFLIKNVA